MKIRVDSGFLIVVLLCSIGFFACDTASNVEDPDLDYFVKYYGYDGNQYGVDMLALDDGSFLLLGNYSESTSKSDIYLLRVDVEGEVIWERRFSEQARGKQHISNALDLEATNDGNFIVLADYQENVGDPTNMKLLKISPDGSLVDSVYFGTNYLFGYPTHDHGRTVTPLGDGGFIVCGTSQLTDQWSIEDPGLDPGDTFSYRFDSNLDLLGTEWGPVILGFGAEKGAQLDVAVKAIESAGAFYVFGYTNSNLDNNNPNARLGLFYFERQSSGTPGRNYYPGNVVNVNDTEIHFVERLPAQMGAGFIIIGTSQSNIGLSEIFLARFQNSLSFAPPLQNDATMYITVPLQRNIRGVSAASSVTGAYGYLVLGNEVRSTLATNFWLSKIDQSGAVLWSTTFGSEARDDYGAAVTQLADGKIMILGTMGLADNQFKMALIKMNPRGELLK
jgi:hypothetical protein